MADGDTIRIERGLWPRPVSSTGEGNP